MLIFGMACLSEANLQVNSICSWYRNLQWWQVLNLPISCWISPTVARQAPFFIIWMRSLSFSLAVILKRFCINSLNPTYWISYILRCDKCKKKEIWLRFCRRWLEMFLSGNLSFVVLFMWLVWAQCSWPSHIQSWTSSNLHCVLSKWSLRQIQLFVFLPGSQWGTEGTINPCRSPHWSHLRI